MSRGSPVPMPQLGQAMESGRLLEWLAADGDQVHEGQVIATIESDKAVYEIEASTSGRLQHVITAGTEVPVGEVLGMIGAGQASAVASARPLASPKAKARARELNVDLRQVESREGKLIVAEQVEAHAARSAAPKSAPVAVSNRRSVVAARLSRSWQQAPHFVQMIDVDATRIDAANKAIRRRDLNCSLNDIFIMALARVLARFADINCTFVDGRVEPRSSVDVGLAVASDDGLVVPVIRAADSMTLDEICAATQALIAASRERGLTPEQTGNAGATISNLGRYGISFGTPVLNLDEPVLVFVGAIQERVVPVSGSIQVRPMMTLSICFDHRVTDGLRAAMFSKALKDELETLEIVQDAVRSPADSGLWRSASLSSQLSRVARRSPDVVALKFAGEERSYALLNDRVSRLANGLLDRGIRPGDRVAVLMRNSLELVESYFAALRSGAICVPMNFRLSADEVAYILQDSGAAFLLCDEEGARLIGDRPNMSVRTVIVCGEDFESVIRSASPDPSGVRVSESDPAFIMYTSGTTGRPKGAVLSHMNLLLNTMNMIASLEIAGSDRCWLAGLPLFHIGGLNGILPFLHLGRTCVILPSGDFNAATVVDSLEREGITSCFFVPTQLQAICEIPGIETRKLKLQRISWGASPIPPSTLAAVLRIFPGVRAYNAFGQTEMSSITCVMRVDLMPEKGVSIGKPVSGVEVRIIDDQGDDVAPGTAGEIIYRGPTVMLGYWGDERATDEAFRGGWFHSGDIVVADEDGYLYVKDRLKDMIISGGENIYSSEVESVIDAHPQVREVAVIGAPHPKWVETPIAVVTLIEGASVTEAELIQWCRERLASYKKPTRVFFVDALPRNAAGKVLKNRLRQQFSGQAPRVS